jgi:prevent-host-death family protein
MQTYNIHEAKTHLSRLVEQATRGEPFVIAKAGKPLVKVVALEAAETKPKSRIGFLKDRFESGEFRVPDDFDTMCADEILELFGIEK